MSSPFVAEIRMWACNFAPTGWALCNGQLIPISQHTALFSLCGTYYGGDGKSTFALPNLQDNVAVNQGQSNWGRDFFLGEQSGNEYITLQQTEIPLHTHSAVGTTDTGLFKQSAPSPIGTWGAPEREVPFASGALGTMSPGAIGPTGSSLPHNNMQPFLTLTFCIALQGVFPPRP